MATTGSGRQRAELLAAMRLTLDYEDVKRVVLWGGGGEPASQSCAYPADRNPHGVWRRANARCYAFIGHSAAKSESYIIQVTFGEAREFGPYRLPQLEIRDSV
jgi:hypothetical protein